jgi:uncharacterized 2Fe-2S/4Fe-4S cluster protein (DUF4445 family)
VEVQVLALNQKDGQVPMTVAMQANNCIVALEVGSSIQIMHLLFAGIEDQELVDNLHVET